MSLRKITPAVTRHNLGALRLWQDELAEIVRLVGQLPDVKVSIEADDHTLTDVEADLPQLGQRVSYFTVTGLRASLDGPMEVVGVHLARHGSYIEAPDPDLTTLGLIDRIEAVLKPRRRLSAKLEPLFDIWTKPTTVPQPGTTDARGTAAALALLAAAGGAVVAVVWGIAAIQHMLHPHHKTYASWPTSIWVAVIALAVSASAIFGISHASTTLFTETHQAAPTWWERNRAAVAITAVASLLSLLAGWLIAKA